MKNKSKYVSKTNSNLAWNDLLSRQICYTESSHSVNSLRVNIKATKLSHSKHLETRIIFHLIYRISFLSISYLTVQWHLIF